MDVIWQWIIEFCHFLEENILIDQEHFVEEEEEEVDTQSDKLTLVL